MRSDRNQAHRTSVLKENRFTGLFYGRFETMNKHVRTWALRAVIGMATSSIRIGARWIVYLVCDFRCGREDAAQVWLIVPTALSVEPMAQPSKHPIKPTAECTHSADP